MKPNDALLIVGNGLDLNLPTSYGQARYRWKHMLSQDTIRNMNRCIITVIKPSCKLCE